MKRLFALATLLLASGAALAQTVTLTPSVTSGNGSLTTKLTWSTQPAAASCSASGHASWSGTKAASGSVDLPAITSSGTYTLTLSCDWPVDNTATVTWVAPTTHTDGAPLLKCASADSTGDCLAYFNVYRSTNSRLEGAEVVPVRDPNATTWTSRALPASTQYFGVEVVLGTGVPADMSNIASKVISAAATRSQSVTVTVNPKASPATVTVK